MKCYCDSNIDFDACCKPYLDKGMLAPTAEKLMRSRYSAFKSNNARYLMETSLHVKENEEQALNNYFEQVQWLQLEVIKAEALKVEYKAYFMMDNKVDVLHERSNFVQENGKLLYSDGEILQAKIERNMSCPCGSGKKYKKCHG
jgi:SEC-C motif-containing protein